jgi:hypothetical protein
MRSICSHRRLDERIHHLPGRFATPNRNSAIRASSPPTVVHFGSIACQPLATIESEGTAEHSHGSSGWAHSEEDNVAVGWSGYRDHAMSNRLIATLLLALAVLSASVSATYFTSPTATSRRVDGTVQGRGQGSPDCSQLCTCDARPGQRARRLCGLNPSSEAAMVHECHVASTRDHVTLSRLGANPSRENNDVGAVTPLLSSPSAAVSSHSTPERETCTRPRS